MSTYQQQIRNSYAWQQVRDEYKLRHPNCQDPLQVHLFKRETVVAEDVHHIRPLREYPFLAYYLGNLASLCRDCHVKIEAMLQDGQPTEKYFRRTA